jgi:O-antigen/teichoic acid export membrane protein
LIKKLKVPKGILSLSFSGIISKILNLIAITIAIRIGGNVFFQKFIILQSVMALITVIASYSINLTVTRYTSNLLNENKNQLDELIRKILITVIIIGLVLVLCLFIIGPYLAIQIYHDHKLVFLLRLSGLVLFSILLWEFFISIYYGAKKYNKVGNLLIIKAFLTTIFTIYGSFTQNLVFILSSYIVINISMSLIAYINQKQKLGLFDFYSKNKYQSIKLFSVLGNYSLPAFLVVALESFVFWYLLIMLNDSIDASLNVVAFGVFEKWMGIIVFIPRIISKISFVEISGMKLGDLKHFKKVFFKGMYYNLFGIIAISLFLIFTRKYILELNNLDTSIGWSFIIFIIVGSLQALNNYIIQTYNAVGKLWDRLLYTLFWALMFYLFYSYLSENNTLLLVGYSLIGSYFVVIVFQLPKLLSGNIILNKINNQKNN